MKRKTVQGPHYDSILSKNLRALVEHNGDSVNAWAKRYGIQQSTLNRVVSGTSDLTVGRLIDWAEKIGCRAEDLLRTGFEPSKVVSTPNAEAQRVASMYMSIPTKADRELAASLLLRLSHAAPSRPGTDHEPASASEA